MRLRILWAAVLGLALCAGESPARADFVGELRLGGSYTGNPPLNYLFNGHYDGGGGSIDDSYLNGYRLPFVYCTDIPDVVWVPGTYTYTLVNRAGQEWWGPGNPISGFVNVPHADSVAYLLSAYGASASAIGRDAMGGLQAAIWQVIYGSPMFQYIGGTGSDVYFNKYITDVYNGHSSDPNQWRTVALDRVLWMSPSLDPNISSTHRPGQIYQGLITLVPEPSTIAIASLGTLLATAYGLRRRPSHA